MTNVLITGAAGNVGGSLAHHLVASGDYRVVGVDNFKTGSPDKLPENGDRFRFVKADVNDWKDISSIILANNFDYVFHYAATVGVQRTLANPIEVLNDIHGIEHVLKLCKSSSVRRVFFSSSSEVYGEPVEIPQREDTTPLNSRLPYAIVKNVGEAYMKSYWREFRLPFTILRFFNTYGPMQSDDFVIAKFVRRALAGDDIPLYGGGTQTRTFCHVSDNYAFTRKLLENDLGLNETINVGSDREMTIRELAQAVIDITGSNSNIVDLPALEEGDMTRRCPDNSRMREILGRDLMPLQDGLDDVIQHIRLQSNLS